MALVNIQKYNLKSSFNYFQPWLLKSSLDISSSPLKMLPVVIPINSATTFQTLSLMPASLKIPTPRLLVKALSRTPSVWSSVKSIPKLKSTSSKLPDKPSRKSAMIQTKSEWITRLQLLSSPWTDKVPISLNQSILKRTSSTSEPETKASWSDTLQTKPKNSCPWATNSAHSSSEDYNNAEEKRSYHGWDLMPRFKSL